MYYYYFENTFMWSIVINNLFYVLKKFPVFSILLASRACVTRLFLCLFFEQNVADPLIVTFWTSDFVDEAQIYPD